MKAPRFLRREFDAPTLRERAAALKAKAATLLRRPSKDADPQRRTMMATGLAAAVAAPLPAFAAAQAPHADQALFDAETAWREAERAREVAIKAYRIARTSVNRAKGEIPAELLMTKSEWDVIFDWGFGSRRFGRISTHAVYPYADPESERVGSGQAWTTSGLRTVIQRAVPALGRGGTTPHHIRRWKALLPAAEAYDAHLAMLQARFRTDELFEAEREAQRTYHAAARRFEAMTATTLDGLAVKARWVAGTSWHDSSTVWTSLLQSAAAITGVQLRSSDFDCAAWVENFEALGGICKRVGDSGDWSFYSPPKPVGTYESHPATAAINRAGSHFYELRRYLDVIRPV